MNWTGVLPAMTTAFAPDFTVDHPAVARHAQWLIENGCTGIVCLGSLGEASTLTFEEKSDILETVVAALGGKAPVVRPSPRFRPLKLWTLRARPSPPAAPA